MMRITGLRMGAKGLWEAGQLGLSMGLVWREVRILAQRATTSSKGIFHLLPQMYCLILYVP
jgi:hypothetical protein